MATYPAIIQVVGSKEVSEDGTVVERAESGRPRFRTFYSEVQKTFLIQHECYSDEKDALTLFYSLNKWEIIDFVWQGDGLTYPCRFSAPPQCTPVVGDGYWSITTSLVVV